jgi:hypothetical protein
VPYRYVTGYRSSSTARLALQRGEIHLHSETTPGFFSVVEPSLVKPGAVIPLYYDGNYDGDRFSVPKVMKGYPLRVPGFLPQPQRRAADWLAMGAPPPPGSRSRRRRGLRPILPRRSIGRLWQASRRPRRSSGCAAMAS